MDEWAKTLLSAGAGLVAGLVAEPVKYQVVAWAKRRQAKEDLYKEMGLNYYLLNRVFDLCHGNAELTNDDHRRERERAVDLLNSISIATYEHYTANEKGIFLRLDDAPAIKKVYDAMREAAGDRSAPWPERYKSVCDVFRIVKRYQKEGALDIPLLVKHRAAYRERTIDRIERYHASRDSKDPEATDISALILDSRYAPRKH